MERECSGAETAIDIRANTHGGWTLDGEYVDNNGDDKKRGWTTDGEHMDAQRGDMERRLKSRWIGVRGLDGSV